ncbi:uncharacterized protein [Cicer arietinum]|uniref:uncharacterized protein isoform X2 n=1 Tax=Cicer arietinum TaxID=3827 RepID=UPI003CC5C993
MNSEGENHVTKDHNDISCRRAVSLPVAFKDDDLLLEIPSRTPEECSQDFVAIKMPMTPSPTPTPKRVNFLVSSRSVGALINNSPGSETSKGKSSIRNFLPKLSFMYRTPANIEKANTPTPEVLSSGSREKPLISRSLSLSKTFSPRIKRTSSLPVEDIGISNTESTHGGNGSVGGPPLSTRRKIARSLSMPTNNKDKSLRRMDSFFRVVPSTSRVKEINELLSVSSTKDTENEDADDGGEDIAKEEAVCRICLVELCEGGETFKLECSCKGELALAHQECAIKWFSIKGNKTCDVCKEDVKNLPVTILRIQSVRNQISGASRSPLEDVNGSRVWMEVPMLVIVSILGYFFFLEQLLFAKMGTGAIATALPFSCVLGLLSSMTSSTMVQSRFIWIYASFQFAMVVLFAHIFYSLVHLQAVLSVLLATFAGFGVVMSGSYIPVEFFRWRRRWQALQEQQHGAQLMTQAGQQPQAVNTPRLDASNDSHPVVQDLQNSNQS